MFYDLFVKLCVRKGVSPSHAAQSVGCNRSAVAKWKQGATPHLETVKKLAAYFGVTLEAMMTYPPNVSAAEIELAAVSADPFLTFYGEVRPFLNEEDLRDVQAYLRVKAELRRGAAACGQNEKK